MKRSKLFLAAAFLLAIGGATATRVHAKAFTTFYISSGGVCTTTTSAPPVLAPLDRSVQSAASPIMAKV